MTGKEILKYEVDAVGRQLDKCLEGMSEETFHSKCSQVGMTPSEMLEHLADAYEAYVVTLRGEKYNFGSFDPGERSAANLKQVFRRQREKAVQAMMASEKDDDLKHAYDYIVGHDNYHVAQLALCRMQCDPEWDPYAIYG